MVTRKEKDAAAKKPKAKAVVFHDDDRSIELRLRLDENGEARVITLAEPNVLQVTQLNSLFKRADEAMPEMPPVPPADADDETKAKLLEARAKALDEQNAYVRGETAPDGIPPFAGAFLELVHVLGHPEVTIEDLPPGTTMPVTSQQILLFYKSPLPGVVEM